MADKIVLEYTHEPKREYELNIIEVANGFIAEEICTETADKGKTFVFNSPSDLGEFVRDYMAGKI